jgi:hypothetical protein
MEQDEPWFGPPTFVAKLFSQPARRSTSLSVLNRLHFATGCTLTKPVQYCKRFFDGAAASREITP